MSVDSLTSKTEVKGFLFVVKKRQKQNSKKTNNYLYFISYGCTLLIRQEIPLWKLPHFTILSNK